MADKNKGGRPSNYKSEYAEQAYKLCLLGAIDKDMADFFGVPESTINNWKKNHKEFLESIKRGKIQADATVASKLYHRAIGYEHPEIITASFQGMITDTKTVTKHYAPDTTAAIIWLKNRQPEKWRDKQEVESKVTADVSMTIKLSPEDEALINRTNFETAEGAEVLKHMKEKYPGIV